MEISRFAKCALFNLVNQTQRRYRFAMVMLPLEISSNFCVFVIKVHVAARIDTTSIFNERKLHIIQLSNAINAQRIYLGSRTLLNIINIMQLKSVVPFLLLRSFVAYVCLR